MSLVAAPALAMPPALPVAVDDDTRLYLLIGSGVLLFVALVMRLVRRRNEANDADDARPGYGMRFFPPDRPIPLE